MKQTELAQMTKFSEAYISYILSGRKRINRWATAEKFAAATKTEPMFWIKSTPEEKRTVVSAAKFTPQPSPRSPAASERRRGDRRERARRTHP